jgi:hypothetical protein
MGVPAQKYGLDSTATYLGMLQFRNAQEKEREEQKAKALERNIAALETWIREAEEVKVSKPESYWNIVNDPSVVVMKTVLRQYELKTSGKAAELKLRLVENNVQVNQIEWDAKLDEWKTKLTSLKCSGEERDASAARASDDDMDMGSQDELDDIV